MDIDEQVICGGPGDFMTVRRLRILGTNFEIGRAIGNIARERYGQTPGLYRTEPDFGRARRQYFQCHYPILWERMRGVATAFKADPEDDSFDLPALTYGIGLPLPSAGCSAVYVPPSSTATGHGLLSRNFYFSVGSMRESYFRVILSVLLFLAAACRLDWRASPWGPASPARRFQRRLGPTSEEPTPMRHRTVKIKKLTRTLLSTCG
jgi:hypothetical protein